MNSEIGYLEELREDLLSAAWREARPTRRSFRRPRRLPRGRLVAALAAMSLILAGGIGWYALRGDGSTETRAENINDLPAVVPSASPAPNGALQQGNDSAGYGGSTGAEKAVSGQGAGFKNDGGSSGPSGVDTSAPTADLSRVIKTAQMSVVVPATTPFADALMKARDIAQQNGGYVSNSTMQPGKTGHLEIRVPARRFNDVLDQLGSLGRLESQSVKGQDVTAKFVDLHARLTISQTRRTVLLKLLSKSHSIEQTIRVQNVLDEVQLTIEQLQGQIRVLKNETSKATIDLSLRKSGVALPVVGGVKHPGLGSAWAHAIAGFFGVVFAVVVGLGYLVPVAIIALIAYLIVRRLRRRSPAFVED